MIGDHQSHSNQENRSAANAMIQKTPNTRPVKFADQDDFRFVGFFLAPSPLPLVFLRPFDFEAIIS